MFLSSFVSTVAAFAKSHTISTAEWHDQWYEDSGHDDQEEKYAIHCYRLELVPALQSFGMQPGETWGVRPAVHVHSGSAG
jgi:hypothetical protein